MNTKNEIQFTFVTVINELDTYDLLSIMRNRIGNHFLIWKNSGWYFSRGQVFRKRFAWSVSKSAQCIGALPQSKIRCRHQSVYRNIDDTNLTSDFAFADDYLKKIYHDNSVSSEIKNNFLYKELRLAILQLNIKKT